MKILIVQDVLRSGGTERQSLLLSRACAAAGHATVLLTFRPGGALAPIAPERESFRWHVLQPFDLGLDWFAPGLFSFVERTTPDIVLCMGRMANCHAGSIQNLVADSRPDCAVIGTMRTGKRLPWFYRWSLRRVRHVIANSRAASEQLVAREGLAPGKITVIPNPLVFPAEAVGGHDESLRARFGAGPGTTVLLCVAMFRPEKNQRELVEIAAGLPARLDWQLWLAGEGPARDACEKLVARLGLAARVKFLGFQANPGPLYAGADIAVHASWSESLSNFLIEAQAHGLPAVACEAQGIRECFLPGETGWSVTPGDRTGFRAALTRLIDVPLTARAERAAKARDFARATFDPARQIAAHLELFARLASEVGTGGPPVRSEP